MCFFARNSAPALAKIVAKIQKNQKNSKHSKNCSLVGIANFRKLSEIMKFR